MCRGGERPASTPTSRTITTIWRREAEHPLFCVRDGLTVHACSGQPVPVVETELERKEESMCAYLALSFFCGLCAQVLGFLPKRKDVTELSPPSSAGEGDGCECGSSPFPGPLYVKYVIVPARRAGSARVGMHRYTRMLWSLRFSRPYKIRFPACNLSVAGSFSEPRQRPPEAAGGSTPPSLAVAICWRRQEGWRLGSVRMFGARSLPCWVCRRRGRRGALRVRSWLAALRAQLPRGGGGTSRRSWTCCRSSLVRFALRVACGSSGVSGCRRRRTHPCSGGRPYSAEEEEE